MRQWQADVLFQVRAYLGPFKLYMTEYLSHSRRRYYW